MDWLQEIPLWAWGVAPLAAIYIAGVIWTIRKLDAGHTPITDWDRQYSVLGGVLEDFAMIFLWPIFYLPMYIHQEVWPGKAKERRLQKLKEQDPDYRLAVTEVKGVQDQ